ncbi:MAG: hypothetical protein ACP5RN_09570 [Armatimonadota bacterium]
MAVDLDGNGLDPGDWWVFNSIIPLQSTDFGGNAATFSSTFDLGSLNPSGTYTLYASFDQSPRSLGDISSMQVSTLMFSLYDIGDLQDGINLGLDAGAGGRGANSSPPSSGNPGLSPASTIIGRVRHDTPGIKQKKNECAPTSAAQSLLWLQKRHPGALGGKLPGQNDLIDKLKTAMDWDDGIAPEDFEPGKKQVIKDLNLDSLIITKSGGQFDGINTFDFVKQEIERGEDVELRIQYKDAAGNNDGGHWVTVAGWFDDGTKKKLFFKDPLTGGDTVDEYELDGTRIKNYKYGGNAYISFAVAVGNPRTRHHGAVRYRRVGARSGSTASPQALATGGEARVVASSIGTAGASPSVCPAFVAAPAEIRAEWSAKHSPFPPRMRSRRLIPYTPHRV